MFLLLISMLFCFKRGVVCGFLVVVGALTPFATAMLSCVMIVAIATSAIPNVKASCPVAWVAQFLYLPEPLYLVILIWPFISGPGWLSVDHLVLRQMDV
jgi:uncharacterized membrane protein YphA (DoxX/SURF4 family)